MSPTVGTRAALYARYSSDLQRAASIEDQLRLLRERAARDGIAVAAEFSDAAISGAATATRPGLLALLAAARRGEFDLVLAEALDRLSRDQEDVAGLYKRLRHAGVAIVTLAEGAVDELHIGLKGTMNALFVRDLAAKVRRGQRGRVAAGRIPGGLTYGYRRVREIDAAGEIEGGRRTIDDAEASIVRRIFADYAAGVSPRAIAQRLNAEGVPAPRGGLWNASTINGHRARQNGILANALYAGRIVYNRQSFAKDPETGKRQARANPKAAWISAEVPDLRIVDDDTWRRVQERKARGAGQPAHHQRRPKRLLSGLVACGPCGGAYTLMNDYMGCSAHRERGTCANARTIRAGALERRVLEGLKVRLLAPEFVASFVREFLAAQAERRREGARAAAAADRRGAELGRRIARLVAAIAEGTDTPAMRRALVEAERERAAAEGTRGGPDAAAAIVLHPRLPELYRDRIAALEEALAAPTDAARAEAFAILRGLIDRIVVHPGPARGESRIELHGQLAGILAALHAAGNEKGAPTVSGQGALGKVKVVAGGGSVRYLPYPPVVFEV